MNSWLVIVRSEVR